MDESELELGRKAARHLFSSFWNAAIKPHLDSALDPIRTRKNALPTRLLHFTGLSEALSILKSKTLRLYRARAASDPLEIEYGIRLGISVLQERGSAELKQLLLSPAVSLEFDPHVACFTEESAGDELLHWALYGRNGAGVALVFDPRPIVAREPEPGLAKVSYSASKHREMVVHLIGEAEAALTTAKKTARTYGMQLTPELLKTVQAFQQLLPMLATGMKREAFAAEHEWRFHVSHVPDLIGSDPPHSHEWKMDVDAKGSLLRSFFELPFQPMDLKAIILNPEHADLNKPVLSRLLEQHGYVETSVETMPHPILRVR